MSLDIILAIISTIAGVISAWIAWKEHIKHSKMNSYHLQTRKLSIPGLWIGILGSIITGFLCKEFITLFAFFLCFVSIITFDIFYICSADRSNFLLDLLIIFLIFFPIFFAIFGITAYVTLFLTTNDDDFVKAIAVTSTFFMIPGFTSIIFPRVLIQSSMGYENEEIWTICSLTVLIGLGLGFILRLTVQ